MRKKDITSYAHCAHRHAQARRPLSVLIACEESQAECKAFRELGHNAFSCDIQCCRSGGHPEWHIHGDCVPYLFGQTSFDTQDGLHHEVTGWDLIIAHPPCTYICKVSSVQLTRWIDGEAWLNENRLKKMIDAAAFFNLCLHATAPFVAVENPQPMARAQLPKPDFFICPSWFGVKYTKKTLWWVRNLPPIMADIDYPNPKEYVRSSRGKYRSRTFPQVARAIARQWSQYILDSLNTQLDHATGTRRKD